MTGITGGTTNNSPQVSINSSRGTLSSPIGLSVNDVTGSYLFKIYNGISDYNVSGGISSQLTSSSDITKKWPDAILSFFTGNNTDGTFSTFTFNGSGVLTAPIIKASSYATSELPLTPEEGWMIYDSTTHQFKGWNGTSWVILG
jgi:hypothetical protein